MSSTPYLIWYVQNPAASAEFYARLLGRPAIDVSATFALFKLDNGMMLGFWQCNGVQPEVTTIPSMNTCGGEFGLALESRQQVDQRYNELREQKVSILQEPVDMDFGYTFVAGDPDGYRLRIFVPNKD